MSLPDICQFNGCSNESVHRCATCDLWTCNEHHDHGPIGNGPHLAVGSDAAELMALRAQLEEAEADKQVLKAITEVCAQCGSPLISWEPFTKTIEYGADDPVPITYQTIIWTCNNACNGTHGEPPFQWFDHADELLSEAAVREHLSEQRERALREVVDRLDKVIGDTEWWEEVELEPYNGNIRTALDAEFGTALAATPEPQEGQR